MHRQSALASPLPLNGARIAGTSAAIALHAIVLMMLFTPTTWQPPTRDAAPTDTPVPVDYLTKPVVDVKPPKPDPKPEQRAHSTPAAKPITAQVIAVESDTGPQVIPTDIKPIDVGEGEPQSSVMAELSPDVAPVPTYPLLALRAGTTGLVLLRIDVDASGRPVAGDIEKSSGSRLLDQAALKFVLARWHFNPALRAGKPISAVALVPISFSLD